MRVGWVPSRRVKMVPRPATHPDVVRERFRTSLLLSAAQQPSPAPGATALEGSSRPVGKPRRGHKIDEHSHDPAMESGGSVESFPCIYGAVTLGSRAQATQEVPGVEDLPTPFARARKQSRNVTYNQLLGSCLRYGPGLVWPSRPAEGCGYSSLSLLQRTVAIRLLPSPCGRGWTASGVFISRSRTGEGCVAFGADSRVAT